MLLSGLFARKPNEMLPSKPYEQEVKQAEPRLTKQRSLSPSSDDELSSGTSVSSYLGIKLKLKRIEEFHDLSGTS